MTTDEFVAALQENPRTALLAAMQFEYVTAEMIGQLEEINGVTFNLIQSIGEEDGQDAEKVYELFKAAGSPFMFIRFSGVYSSWEDSWNDQVDIVYPQQVQVTVYKTLSEID